jgi:hypothetical protein
MKYPNRILNLEFMDLDPEASYFVFTRSGTLIKGRPDRKYQTSGVLHLCIFRLADASLRNLRIYLVCINFMILLWSNIKNYAPLRVEWSLKILNMF